MTLTHVASAAEVTGLILLTSALVVAALRRSARKLAASAEDRLPGPAALQLEEPIGTGHQQNPVP
jgi:hypothetical protein